MSSFNRDFLFFRYERVNHLHPENDLSHPVHHRQGLPHPIKGAAKGISAAELVDHSNHYFSSASLRSYLGQAQNFLESIFCKENMVVAAKALVAVALIGGLITASVFTFGAAGAVTGAGLSFFIAKGALIGTGIGLVLSTITTAYGAGIANMFTYTENNLEDTLSFLGISLVMSVFITGYCAISGSNEGVRWGLLTMILGGGTTFLKGKN